MSKVQNAMARYQKLLRRHNEGILKSRVLVSSAYYRYLTALSDERREQDNENLPA